MSDPDHDPVCSFAEADHRRSSGRSSEVADCESAEHGTIRWNQKNHKIKRITEIAKPRKRNEA